MSFYETSTFIIVFNVIFYCSKISLKCFCSFEKYMNSHSFMYITAKTFKRKNTAHKIDLCRVVVWLKNKHIFSAPHAEWTIINFQQWDLWTVLLFYISGNMSWVIDLLLWTHVLEMKKIVMIGRKLRGNKNRKGRNILLEVYKQSRI